MIQKKQYHKNAHEFIALLTEKTGAGIVKTEVDYEKKQVKLSILGQNIKKNELAIWQEKLKQFNLETTKLLVQQDEETSKLLEEINTIKSSYVKNQELIASKEESIQEKEIRIQVLIKNLKR